MTKGDGGTRGGGTRGGGISSLLDDIRPISGEHLEVADGLSARTCWFEVGSRPGPRSGSGEYRRLRGGDGVGDELGEIAGEMLWEQTTVDRSR
jgi:hypothetical protein